MGVFLRGSLVGFWIVAAIGPCLNRLHCDFTPVVSTANFIWEAASVKMRAPASTLMAMTLVLGASDVGVYFYSGPVP